MGKKNPSLNSTTMYHPVKLSHIVHCTYPYEMLHSEKSCEKGEWNNSNFFENLSLTMVSLVFINTKHLQIKSDKKSCDCKICNLLGELKDTKITKKEKQSTNKNCIHNLTTYQLQETVTHLGNLKQFTLPFLCMFEFLLLNHFQ